MGLFYVLDINNKTIYSPKLYKWRSVMAGRKPKGKNAIQGFSQRLADARRGQYTQAQLGEIVGLSDQTIKKYEGGSRQPDSFEIIVDLAKALHVSTDYLLGASSEQNAKMRDVANYIGVSQKAAAKLDSLYKDHNRMLPLNGIILHRNFETMLHLLWVLHDESMAVHTAAESGNIGKAEIHTLTERSISGSDLLRHDLDRVTVMARELFSEICMVDEASEKWDHVIADRLLDEYKKQTED